jgi:signal transduction histidine kinase
VLSGRVLRPVRSIVTTAREIQATDLSRRIRLGGPQDELRSLADTVDSMLDRLEQAFGAQRQLIDDASHELRSPLAIIRANLEASLTPDDVDGEERRRAVVVIDRATTRMSRLVEDLLATARRDAPSSSDTPVRLDQLLAEAAEDLTVPAAGRGLRLALPAGPGPTVIGDHDALRRAVGNLLSNAVRLAPAGSTITLATGRTAQPGRTGGWTWITVTDEGPGIRDDDRSRIFDRFWRGTDNGTGDEKREGIWNGTSDGTSQAGPRERRAGLGLAIVRQIVESHRGQVAVHSEPGVGSTFVLWIPAPERTDDVPPPEKPPGSARR